MDSYERRQLDNYITRSDDPVFGVCKKDGESEEDHWFLHRHGQDDLIVCPSPLMDFIMEFITSVNKEEMLAELIPDEWLYEELIPEDPNIP